MALMGLACAEGEHTRLLPYLGSLSWALGKAIPMLSWSFFAAVARHVQPWGSGLALPVDVLVLLLWGTSLSGVRHARSFRAVKKWLLGEDTLSKMSDASIVLLLQASADLQLPLSASCPLSHLFQQCAEPVVTRFCIACLSCKTRCREV